MITPPLTDQIIKTLQVFLSIILILILYYNIPPASVYTCTVLDIYE